MLNIICQINHNSHIEGKKMFDILIRPEVVVHPVAEGHLLLIEDHVLGTHLA